MNTITLTAKQLIAALDFIAPERVTDPDQLDGEICIAHLEGAKDDDGGTCPPGLYMWDSDYPEEGVVPLFDAQSEAA